MKKLYPLFIFLFTVSHLRGQGVSDSTVTDYSRRVMYEIFVRSFSDSNGDGIGDLAGIIQKLDYLKDLGVGGLSLSPVNTSSSYSKYDVEDYYNVDPKYGTLDDFHVLIKEAHKRGIVILMDLVLNACSSKHPWFQEACGNPQGPFRNYFLWSPAALIKSDPQNWYAPPGPGEKTPGVQKFYSSLGDSLPVLNYNNNALRAEVKKIGKFWLEQMGVDGFRFENIQCFPSTGQEKKNLSWWREFRQSMDSVKVGFYMVGDVENSNASATSYLNGAFHSLFNADLATAINNVVLGERNDSLIEKLLATRASHAKSSSRLDAIFTGNRNRNRIMNTMLDNEAKTKLVASILLTLPGMPYLYYGEEIGMRGEKTDELIREPFCWTFSSADSGQTRWEIPVFSIEGKVLALDKQLKDTTSLYWHYKKLIALHNEISALYGDSLSLVPAPWRKFLAYMRTSDLTGGRVLVIHNLSSLPAMFSILDNYTLTERLWGDAIYSKHDRAVTMKPFSTAIYRVE